MLSELKTKPCRWNILYFARKAAPFSAMVVSAGHSKEVSTRYRWHGLQRKWQAGYAMMQYTMSGEGALLYQGTHYRVVPGTAMFLHFPHDNQYWLPDKPGHWEFFYVTLCGEEVLRIWQELERSAGPVLPVDDGSPAMEAALDIVDYVVYNSTHSPFEASALAYRLAMRLAERFLAPHYSRERPEPIERAIKFCRRNLAQQISVDNMAAIAGYSRYHFTRLFAASEGASPGEFLRHLRIREAMRLLENTTLPLREIAARCGFYDEPYFCKVFRKQMSMSPRAFRRSGVFYARAKEEQKQG